MITRRTLLGATAALGCPLVARGQTPGLELTLALDESSSMQTGETTMGDGVEHRHDEIQAKGHANALRTPDITNALFTQQVYLRVIAWSDTNRLVRTIFARRITRWSDITEAAGIIEGHRAPPAGGTDHRKPLEHVLRQPPRGATRVLDIVTDEPVLASRHTGVIAARERFEASGGEMNVLVVGDIDDPDDTLKTMLRSPEGIYLECRSWVDFPAMIRQKLRMELGLA